MEPFNFVDKEGLPEALTAAGLRVVQKGAQWLASDAVAAQAIVDSYDPLPWLKQKKQATLDKHFDEHCDLPRFIREGTVITVTSTQVGNFLRDVTNNYRTLRAQIASAVDQAALSAIDIASGWPSNP